MFFHLYLREQVVRVENDAIRCSLLLFFPTNAIPYHWWWALLISSSSASSRPRTISTILNKVDLSLLEAATRRYHSSLTSRSWSPRNDGHQWSHEGAVWQLVLCQVNTLEQRVFDSVLWICAVRLSRPGISHLVHATLTFRLIRRALSVSTLACWPIQSSRLQCSFSSALNDWKILRRYGRENQSGIRSYRWVDANRPEVPRGVASWRWPTRLSLYSSPFPYLYVVIVSLACIMFMRK